jgi:hypothetical protein
MIQSFKGKVSVLWNFVGILMQSLNFFFPDLVNVFFSSILNSLKFSRE